MFQSSWCKTKIGLCNVMAMGTHSGGNRNSDDPPLPSPYVLSHFLSLKCISGGSRHPAAALRPTAPILQSTSGLRVTLQLQLGVTSRQNPQAIMMVWVEIVIINCVFYPRQVNRTPTVSVTSTTSLLMWWRRSPPLSFTLNCTASKKTFLLSSPSSHFWRCTGSGQRCQMQDF